MKNKITIVLMLMVSYFAYSQNELMTYHTVEDSIDVDFYELSLEDLIEQSASVGSFLK